MTDDAKLRPFVYKMILQKYTSQWIDPTYVLVFRVYLGMAQIFTDFPTGSKMAKHTWSLSISCCYEVYFCKYHFVDKWPQFCSIIQNIDFLSVHHNIRMF